LTKNDGNNNITNYLKVNNDRLLALAEKNYENLVEELTNNVIHTAMASSDSTFSLPQSSSTFPNSFDQINTYRKEESESFDNSKEDIAD